MTTTTHTTTKTTFITIMILTIAATATIFAVPAIMDETASADTYAKGNPNPNAHASNDGTANAFFHTKGNQPCATYCSSD